jgi:hypothetical protein
MNELLRQIDTWAAAHPQNPAYTVLPEGVPIVLDWLAPGERTELSALKSQALLIILALRARVAELEAVVGKLPKTADGVPMTPGGHYWAWCRDEYAEDDDQWEVVEVVWWAGDDEGEFNSQYTLAPSARQPWASFEVGKVYNTEEAAIAAKGAEK